MSVFLILIWFMVNKETSLLPHAQNWHRLAKTFINLNLCCKPLPDRQSFCPFFGWMPVEYPANLLCFKTTEAHTFLRNLFLDLPRQTICDHEPSFQLDLKILLQKKTKSASLNQRAVRKTWGPTVMHFITFLGFFDCFVILERYPTCSSVWPSSCRPFRDSMPAVTLFRDKN